MAGVMRSILWFFCSLVPLELVNDLPNNISLIYQIVSFYVTMTPALILIIVATVAEATLTLIYHLFQ